MTVSNIGASTAAQYLQPSQQVGGRGDPDGGADRAQEMRSRSADIVQLSAPARQYLASNVANDADHGADGK